MTFLNASLLFAVAAIGIPIALHLIARKEPRQVVFPSVRLLTQRFENNRSKLRIRRLWLLALRVLAVAAVALALAQPMISGALAATWSTIGILALFGVAMLAMATMAATKAGQRQLTRALLAAALLMLIVALGWGGFLVASEKPPTVDRARPVALAVVVDNGPLSAWRSGARTQLDRLREAAKPLMTSANPNSRFALIDRSATPAQFSLDLAGALSQAEALQTLEVAQPLPSRIEAAVRLLQTSEIESRQLVILSGMSRSSFPEDAAGDSLVRLLEDAAVRVTLWDLADYAGSNRRLSLATLSDQSPGPESSVSVGAVASLTGDASDAAPNAAMAGPGGGDDVPDAGQQRDAAASGGAGDASPVAVTAECVLFPGSASLPVVRDGAIVRPDAKPVDRVNVELAPGRDVELRLTLPPLPVGLHHGAVRLTGQDAFALDDTSYFTVSVAPPSRLLMVGRSEEELEEIAWMISAPAPLDDPASQYRIERIGYDELANSRIRDFDGVLLLDPPRSSLEEPELQRYRDGGGSVLVALGAAIDPGEVDLESWLPLQRRWRVPEPGTFLQITASSHPALISLASTPGGVPFPDFRIHQYWKVDASDQGQVLMRYAGTDHPALIELGRGSEQTGGPAGRDLVLTTPIPELASPATAWNELFSAAEPWPAFVLVRDLTRYLTGRTAENYSVAVGAPVSMPIRLGSEDGEQRRRLQWFPPVGSTPIPIEVPTVVEEALSGEAVARQIAIGQPKHSGVHWIRGDRQGLGFTVNLPRDALDTAAVPAEELERLFGPEQLSRIDSIEQMEWTAAGESDTVSLWSPVMLLALVAFLLEQVLGNRFYRRRPRAAAASTRGAAA